MPKYAPQVFFHTTPRAFAAVPCLATCVLVRNGGGAGRMQSDASSCQSDFGSTWPRVQKFGLDVDLLLPPLYNTLATASTTATTSRSQPPSATALQSPAAALHLLQHLPTAPLHVLTYRSRPILSITRISQYITRHYEYSHSSLRPAHATIATKDIYKLSHQQQAFFPTTNRPTPL